MKQWSREESIAITVGVAALTLIGAIGLTLLLIYSFQWIVADTIRMSR